MPEFVFETLDIAENENSALLKSATPYGVQAYIQYFINEQGLVYLLKSDVVKASY